MKCPLLSAKILGDTGDRFIMGTCIRRECAWWDKEMSQCSINGLEPTLQHMALSLRDLAKVVTRWRSFKDSAKEPGLTTAFLRTIIDMINRGMEVSAITALKKEVERITGKPEE